MKISFVKIKKIFGSIKNFFKMNPHKHWVFILYLFYTMIIVLIAFSLYLLSQIKNEQIFQVKIDTTANQTVLKEDLLNNTLKNFDLKAAKEMEIKNSPSLYKDPSK